jgi:methionyl-tRNA formyltransferase
MRMEAGLDTGPVAACREEPIFQTDTAGTLAGRLAVAGADLLVETLPRIAAGTVTLTAQKHEEATLAPLLKKEDGYLDFAAPAAVVAARARGVDPWPGTTAFLAGDAIKLFVPRAVDGQGVPGQVLGLGSAGLVVACGEGAIAFEEMQRPGKRRLPASQVLAGRPLPKEMELRAPPHAT